MKTLNITWTDETKHVPGLGVMVTGMKYPVAESIGKNLIKQGQAKKAKATKREVK